MPAERQAGDKALLIFHFFAAMELAMYIAQSLVGHMSIDLGSGEVFMAEHLLDGAQVAAPV